MEALVHISARTTREDDERYKAQALAYLAFETACTTKNAVVSPNVQASAAFSDTRGLSLGLAGRSRANLPHEDPEDPSGDACMNILNSNSDGNENADAVLGSSGEGPFPFPTAPRRAIEPLEINQTSLRRNQLHVNRALSRGRHRSGVIQGPSLGVSSEIVDDDQFTTSSLTGEIPRSSSSGPPSPPSNGRLSIRADADREPLKPPSENGPTDGSPLSKLSRVEADGRLISPITESNKVQSITERAVASDKPSTPALLTGGAACDNLLPSSSASRQPLCLSRNLPPSDFDAALAANERNHDEGDYSSAIHHQNSCCSQGGPVAVNRDKSLEKLPESASPCHASQSKGLDESTLQQYSQVEDSFQRPLESLDQDGLGPNEKTIAGAPSTRSPVRCLVGHGGIPGNFLEPTPDDDYGSTLDPPSAFEVALSLDSCRRPREPTGEKRAQTPDADCLNLPSSPLSRSAAERLDVISEQARRPEIPRTFDFSSLSLELHPPGPAVSHQKFSKLPSQLTPNLKVAASWNEKHGRKFSPAFVARPLRDDERGHWLIDVSTLPLKHQWECWYYLGQATMKGSLGWGVWFSREPPIPEPTHPRKQLALGTIKAFCWGEVVRHVYFLLMGFTHDQVRKARAVWVDSQGEVIVRMSILKVD